jgi:peptidylprolyl isomerase
MAVEKGNKVKVDYEGKLDNGDVFDSSTHGEHTHPLEFEVGEGKVIKGFDDAVMGMNVGEEKEFKIAPENAYGERNEELKREVPKESLKLGEGQKVEKDMTLAMQTPQGPFPVKVLDVKEKTIVLDMNHPLAGENLNFKIKVVEVK